MQLENKLLQMKGNSFMHMANVHKVINFKIIDDKTVHLVTDKNWFEIPVAKADKELRENFIPVEPESAVNGADMVIYNQAKNANLIGVLVSNIETLQKDKSFVPQAKQIAANVQTIINAAKLEIEIKKLKNGKR